MIATSPTVQIQRKFVRKPQFKRLLERRNNPFTLSVLRKSSWASMGLLNAPAGRLFRA